MFEKDETEDIEQEQEFWLDPEETEDVLSYQKAVEQIMAENDSLGYENILNEWRANPIEIDEQEISVNTYTNNQALASFDMLISWAEENGKDLTYVQNLRKMRSDLIEEMGNIDIRTFICNISFIFNK